MGAFLRKDILILLRDYKELVIILLVPFLAITVLGFALRGNGSSGPLTMKVAFVVQDNEESGVERFVQELETRSPAPEMQEDVDTFRPYTLLRTLFATQQLREMIEIVEMDQVSAEQALKNEEVAAILTVPEHFTYFSLQKRVLNEGPGSTLNIVVANYSAIDARVFHDIVDGFVRTINVDSALSQTAHEYGVALETFVPQTNPGRLETVTGSSQPEVTAFQYYTIAEAVMFVLFVASVMASKAFVEKQRHVFNRILLAGKHPLFYLGGKIISTTLIAFLQLALLFTLSALIYQTFAGRDLTFWLWLCVISLLLAFCVATISALLTACAFRIRSSAFTGVFSGILVMLLAVAGGSFVPTTNFPVVLQVIGAWTPNGAALQAYMHAFLGADMTTVLLPLCRLFGVACLFLLISMLVFPRRGDATS